MTAEQQEKARFFAQYWGCKVLYVGGVGLVKVGYGGWNLHHKDFFLELTPLSMITDEDAIQVIRFHEILKGHVCVSEESNIDTIKNVINYIQIHRHDVVDFLRSCGYALPWMGISVEEQVQRGWIKPREPQTDK